MILSFVAGLLPFLGPDKAIKEFVWHTSGKRPRNIALYKQALSHRSRFQQSTHNNERLEFLGDSILNAIIAEYLYNRFPFKEEGFLTELRARIVQRKHLNQIAHDLHMQQYLMIEKGSINFAKSDVLGDTFEAFVGAFYLDHGYHSTRSFILNKVVRGMLDIDKLSEEDSNFKGKIYHYIQKEGKKLEFILKETESNGRHSIFTMELYIDDQLIGSGKGFNKKEAEQLAAKEAIEKLENSQIRF